MTQEKIERLDALFLRFEREAEKLLGEKLIVCSLVSEFGQSVQPVSFNNCSDRQAAILCNAFSVTFAKQTKTTH